MVTKRTNSDIDAEANVSAFEVLYFESSLDPRIKFSVAAAARGPKAAKNNSVIVVVPGSESGLSAI